MIDLKLLDACTQGHHIKLEKLIRQGGDVNLDPDLLINVPNRGYTPLMLAVSNGHFKCVEILVNAGADINRSIGLKNLNESTFNISLSKKHTPLLCACQQHTESFNGELVEFLLHHNANINYQDDDGHTAIFLAIRQGNLPGCQLLLKHQADITIQNDMKYTPLHMAVFWSQADCVKALLEHNADISMTDCVGLNALDMAFKYDRTPIISLLESFHEKKAMLKALSAQDHQEHDAESQMSASLGL